ncbi:histidine kinase [Herbaspirillum hiltneri N3]|uniref:histidine kinase n=1 Tax=Herbaspirillum hiltneri N3 TaxID=1262470 RepID=A0ABM5V4Y7_9BURK|nr:PAS domain-containing sensor histidine kinase [Herbaspirillum hiltneri]AKZ64693.1 histidine kinase [Herbaspirillum hiltneri N3]
MHSSQPAHLALTDAQRFQLIISAIRDYAIYMLDPQGKVTSWNKGAQQFTGYSSEDILGSHFSVFYPLPEREAGLPQRALDVALRDGKFEDEGWRLRKDGTTYWASSIIDPIIADDGELLGFAKITRDITEHKLAAQTLQASEQQFRMLVQGVTDYAIYMLSPEGKVTNWNAGAQRIKGYTAEEVIGTHFSNFYTETDRNDGLPERALMTAAEQGRYEQEGLRVRKDGSTFWAHVIVDAIRSELGDLIGFAKVTRDVTERRETALALARANAALFQSQKMEALGQLTGGVAHDFNNLLAVASSGLQLLTVQFPELENSRSMESIRRALSRGAILTQQLLSFARQQPLQPETHEVNTLIADFESVLRRAGNSSIQFDIRKHPTPVMVRLDATRFETSLLNLVVNATQAMPGGGKVTIATDKLTLRDKAVGTLPSGVYAKISVTDNGSGMTPEVQARVFEPFFTTKEAGQGTGLGLSQVYGFITQSGGEVTLSSEVGVGTCFTIYIPVDTDADAENAQNADKQRTETVLIVDDQLDLLDITAELFRTMGYEAYTATNGAEALEVLERAPQIDILFTDVIMPNSISGIELAQITRQRHPTTKIILASGHPFPALTSNQQLSKEFAFLNKPYQLADLARILRSKN